MQYASLIQDVEVNNLDVISSEALHKLQKLELGIIGNNRATEVLLANTIGLGVLKHSIYGQRKERYGCTR